MAISLNLDAWCVQNGYTIKDISRMNVYSVYDDYEVWLTTDVVLRELGIQIDHQWRDWYLGKLRVFKLINTNDVIENRTKYVYSTGSRHFFDDGLEERLGGEKQTLGAGL